MTKDWTGEAMQENGMNIAAETRKRPEYRPRQIKCKGCGAALSVMDERTEFIVCSYCGSQLDISQAEQRVLGRNPEGKPAFTFEIGESWHQKGARFECIGRMALCEEGNLADMTLLYLFYNPRMGSFYVGEYQGSFSMTRPSHVMPVGGGLGKRRGDVIETWDKRKWVCEGSGTYELYYVDGALPWIAKKGDRIEYAEFAAADGSGRIYEIERIEGEIEYGAGRRLSARTVSAATGRKDICEVRERADAATERKWYLQTMAVAALFLFINAVFASWVWNAGTVVLKENIPPAKLTEGFLSRPFELAGGNSAVRIRFDARIDNAWMAVESRLVKEGGEESFELVDTRQATIEYYEGYEGGEHWSEGSTSESVMVKVPEPGTYRLFVQGVSAAGNTADSDVARHSLSVTVTDRAQPRIWAIGAMALCALIMVVTIIMYSAWKEFDEE